MFLQNLEKSIEKDFQSFLKNNYSGKFIKKILLFIKLEKLILTLLAQLVLLFLYQAFFYLCLLCYSYQKQLLYFA